MSVESIALVLHHSQAKGTDKLVLIGIANHDGDGGAWPTLETLGRYASCSRTRVKQAIRRLVELGEVSVEVQAGGNFDTRPDRRPNMYRVLVSCPVDCDRSSQHRNGGQTGASRRRGGQNTPTRGAEYPPTGGTRVPPNHPLEPSLEPKEPVADATPSQRVNTLAKLYTDKVPLSNFLAVRGVVAKAVKAGMWSDDEIAAALGRMAEDGRSVTTDGLRYELNGFPVRQSNRTRALAAGAERTRKLAERETSLWEIEA